MKEKLVLKVQFKKKKQLNVKGILINGINISSMLIYYHNKDGQLGYLENRAIRTTV